MKTEYRIINDGWKNFLQYKKTTKISFFIFEKNIESWEYVPTNYFDKICGRSLGQDNNRLNSYNVSGVSLEKWASEHPYIDEYLIITEIEIETKKNEAKKWHKELENKQKQIKYLS